MEPCVRKEMPKDLQPNVFLRKLTAVYYVVLDEDLTRAYIMGLSQWLSRKRIHLQCRRHRK